MTFARMKMLNVIRARVLASSERFQLFFPLKIIQVLSYFANFVKGANFQLRKVPEAKKISSLTRIFFVKNEYLSRDRP